MLAITAEEEAGLRRYLATFYNYCRLSEQCFNLRDDAACVELDRAAEVLDSDYYTYYSKVVRHMTNEQSEELAETLGVNTVRNVAQRLGYAQRQRGVRP